MTDDLDRLRTALKAATPESDPARRAATLAAAMTAFDAHVSAPAQETARDQRPMSDRPSGTGFLTGVRLMLTNFTNRHALAATASVAALAVGLGVVLTQMPKGVAPLPTTDLTTAPEKAIQTIAPMAKPATPPAQTAASGQVTANAPAAVAAENRTAGTGPKAKPEADSPTVLGRAGQTATPADTLSEVAPPAAPLAKAAPAEAKLRRERSDANALSDAMSAPLPQTTTSADVGKVDQSGTALPEGEAALTSGAMAPSVMEPAFAPSPNTEAYPVAKANPVHITAEDPVSTFSIDVDTASYAVVRSSLMNGYLPPPEAVRIEEMVNYFPYTYPAPKVGEAPFKPTVTVTQTPWNPDTRLVHIGIQGRLPATGDRPALNLVFLIDTSGSMEDPNKLPLLKQSFRLMLGQLRPEDRIAIVTYAGSAGEVLAPTPASDQAKILAALDNLAAGGSTAGQEGLQQAYAVADGMKKDGTVTRILLATDGDFNVGISDPEQLKTFIAAERKTGTYLSVLGFGRGNLDDATMQALAQNGNGTAAYIDTLSEAQKVLVDQLTGALFPIADDVKIQMEFNPAVVAEYRLIGYETRALAREDFNNDKVDAGEIGAGTSVTALYEVTPVGSPALRADPLRYQADAAPEKPAADMELGYLKLRYKDPGASVSKLIALPISPEPTQADADTRFAAAIAGMGQLLTGATYLNDWGWDDAIKLAAGAKGNDPFGYRAEAVQLMRLGQSLQGK